MLKTEGVIADYLQSFMLIPGDIFHIRDRKKNQYHPFADAVWRKGLLKGDFPDSRKGEQ